MKRHRSRGWKFAAFWYPKELTSTSWTATTSRRWIQPRGSSRSGWHVRNLRGSSRDLSNAFNSTSRRVQRNFTARRLPPMWYRPNQEVPDVAVGQLRTSVHRRHAAPRRLLLGVLEAQASAGDSDQERRADQREEQRFPHAAARGDGELVLRHRRLLAAQRRERQLRRRAGSNLPSSLGEGRRRASRSLTSVAFHRPDDRLLAGLHGGAAGEGKCFEDPEGSAVGCDRPGDAAAGSIEERRSGRRQTNHFIQPEDRQLPRHRRTSLDAAALRVRLQPDSGRWVSVGKRSGRSRVRQRRLGSVAQCKFLRTSGSVATSHQSWRQCQRVR